MSASCGNSDKSSCSDNTGAALGRLSFTVSEVGLGHKDDPKDIDGVARPLIKASILEFFRIWLIAGNMDEDVWGCIVHVLGLIIFFSSANAAFVVPCR